MVTDSAAEFKTNVLRWSIPSHNISITNTNGEDSSDVSRNNFVSTVSNYDDEFYITNASLATSDLDESVVVCMNAVDMSSNCTLFIKSKYQLYLVIFEILFVIKKPQT